MEENVRIPEAELPSNFVDGEVVGHTDLNKIISILKAGVNANYTDILDIIEGIITVENAVKLDGASLAKSSELTIGADDAKVPTNGLVYTYLQTIINELNQRIDSMSGSSSSESYTIELTPDDFSGITETNTAILNEIKAKCELENVLPDITVIVPLDESETYILKGTSILKTNGVVSMINVDGCSALHGATLSTIVLSFSYVNGSWELQAAGN